MSVRRRATDSLFWKRGDRHSKTSETNKATHKEGRTEDPFSRHRRPSPQLLRNPKFSLRFFQPPHTLKKLPEQVCAERLFGSCSIARQHPSAVAV
jgi:hypothetical protein